MAWTRVITTDDDGAYKNTNVPNQTISISGQDVTLSNSGGTITIPDLDTQDLSISGQTLSLTNGGSVTLPDLDTQNISISGNTITLVDGGTVDVSTATAVAANTAKNTNVSTDLGITGSTGARVITSSDGTDATIPVASALASGVMSQASFNALDAIEASATADQNASEITALLNDVASYSLGDASSGTITVNNDLTVTGDLLVSGDTVTVNTATLSVEDNVVTLNSNATGTTTPDVDAGIEVERGSRTNTYINWDEGKHYWTQKTQKNSNNDDDGASGMIPMVESGTGTSGSASAVGNFYVKTDTNDLYVNV